MARNTSASFRFSLVVARRAHEEPAAPIRARSFLGRSQFRAAEVEAFSDTRLGGFGLMNGRKAGFAQHGRNEDDICSKKKVTDWKSCTLPGGSPLALCADGAHRCRQFMKAPSSRAPRIFSSRFFRRPLFAIALTLLVTPFAFTGCMTPQDRAFYGRGWLNPSELDREEPPPQNMRDPTAIPPKMMGPGYY